MPNDKLNELAGNSNVAYVDAIQRCHRFYETAFGEERILIAATIAFAFNRNVWEVKVHLKKGSL
jgi:hypothetical protein